MQVWFSVSFPVQLTPPYSAGVLVLFLTWVPPPQLAEQVSHEPHAFNVQLTWFIKIAYKLRFDSALVEIILYQGRDRHCRFGFQCHFLYNWHHHIGQEYLFYFFLGCHPHKSQSKLPMQSMHSKCSPLDS